MVTKAGGLMHADAATGAPIALLGDRYRLESPIGSGGTSTVYRAVDERLGRNVAVKVFNGEGSEQGRQESELAVLAGLDHHNLIGLLDAGTFTDATGRASRYMVMTLITGTDLGERLRGPRISSRNIGEIGYDIAEALEYIHSKGVIHRDIKPSNVMLVDYGIGTRRARAKLTDFGIALTDDVERITREGQATGTAAYLSPEQVRGGEITPATDVYSLGLLLLQCFTKKLEYPGTAVESALARLTRDPVIPPLPLHWQLLLSSMLASDPDERPGARELVAAIRQVIITDSGKHKNDPEDFSPTGSGLTEAQSTFLHAIPNEVLHRVTAMAARVFDAQIATVSLVDENQNRLASYFGDNVEEIVRQVYSGDPTPPLPDPLIITNAKKDARTKDSPLVKEPFNIRFYAGMPLKRDDGSIIGTLSVLDTSSINPTTQQIASLEDLAALVVAQLDDRQDDSRSDEAQSATT
jgi:serine/threonine protein kinase